MIEEFFYSVERDAQGQERFHATDMTRGPWSNEHQHGGPPAALLLRAIERGSDGFLTARLTVDFLRPVPMGPRLEVEAVTVSAGRRVQRLRATLRSEGRELAVASAVQILKAELPVEVEAHPERELRSPEECRPMVFDFFQHDVGYHTAVELLVADGEFGRGKLACWMRPRVRLLDDEPTRPSERVVICADAGHGIGAALRPRDYSFVNPDMTVYLHRLPEGEWLGMDARTWTSDRSIGLCRTELLDPSGNVGCVLQSQVVAARSAEPPG